MKRKWTKESAERYIAKGGLEKVKAKVYMLSANLNLHNCK